MEHCKQFTAVILSAFAIFSVMAVLFACSSTNVPRLQNTSCDDYCQSGSAQQAGGDESVKGPTLAPPRINTLSQADNSFKTSTFGQPIYIQVKADRSEIEVGWASGESMGR